MATNSNPDPIIAKILMRGLRNPIMREAWTLGPWIDRIGDRLGAAADMVGSLIDRVVTPSGFTRVEWERATRPGIRTTDEVLEDLRWMREREERPTQVGLNRNRPLPPSPEDQAIITETVDRLKLGLEGQEKVPDMEFPVIRDRGPQESYAYDYKGTIGGEEIMQPGARLSPNLNPLRYAGSLEEGTKQRHWGTPEPVYRTITGNAYVPPEIPRTREALYEFYRQIQLPALAAAGVGLVPSDATAQGSGGGLVEGLGGGGGGEPPPTELPDRHDQIYDMLERGFTAEATAQAPNPVRDDRELLIQEEGPDGFVTWRRVPVMGEAKPNPNLIDAEEVLARQRRLEEAPALEGLARGLSYLEAGVRGAPTAIALLTGNPGLIRQSFESMGTAPGARELKERLDVGMAAAERADPASRGVALMYEQLPFEAIAPLMGLGRAGLGRLGEYIADDITRATARGLGNIATGMTPELARGAMSRREMLKGLGIGALGLKGSVDDLTRAARSPAGWAYFDSSVGELEMPLEYYMREQYLLDMEDARQMMSEPNERARWLKYFSGKKSPEEAHLDDFWMIDRAEALGITPEEFRPDWNYLNSLDLPDTPEGRAIGDLISGLDEGTPGPIRDRLNPYWPGKKPPEIPPPPTEPLTKGLSAADEDYYRALHEKYRVEKPFEELTEDELAALSFADDIEIIPETFDMEDIVKHLKNEDMIWGRSLSDEVDDALPGITDPNDWTIQGPPVEGDLPFLGDEGMMQYSPEFGFVDLPQPPGGTIPPRRFGFGGPTGNMTPIDPFDIGQIGPDDAENMIDNILMDFDQRYVYNLANGIPLSPEQRELASLRRKLATSDMTPEQKSEFIDLFTLDFSSRVSARAGVTREQGERAVLQSLRALLADAPEGGGRLIGRVERATPSISGAQAAEAETLQGLIDREIDSAIDNLASLHEGTGSADLYEHSLASSNARFRQWVQAQSQQLGKSAKEVELEAMKLVRLDVSSRLPSNWDQMQPHSKRASLQQAISEAFRAIASKPHGG